MKIELNNKIYSTNNFINQFGYQMLSALQLLHAPLQAATNTQNSIPSRGTYVGKLQEKWTLPSDHLPIGMRLGNETILSWNVLNTLHMSWVMEKDSQGIKDSVVGKEHIVVREDGLTLRDQHVAQLICDMDFTVLALQEAGTPFIEYLREILPSRYQIIHQGELAVLFDTEIYSCTDSFEAKDIFLPWDKRPVQHIDLQRTDGSSLHIVNGHLPGDPTKPAPEVFAEHLNTLANGSDVIGLGDMNFNEVEMGSAFENSPFTLYSPEYCTNVSPFAYFSKTIDHFMVSSNKQVEMFTPDMIIPGLGHLSALLENDQ